MENKGEGSSFQARDLSGWEFATMSKTSVFQLSGVFPFYSTRGYARLLIICVEYKDGIFCAQDKNIPCVVYTVMRLILWKHSHGREAIVLSISGVE